MEFAQAFFLDVVAVGSVYALFALAFSLTYSSSRTLNFGQGECMFASAAAAQTCLVASGGNWFSAILVGLLTGALLSLGVAYLAVKPFLRPARRLGGYGWLLATLACGIVIRNLIERLWGQEERPLRLIGFHVSASVQSGEIARWVDVSIISGALVVFLVIRSLYRVPSLGYGMRIAQEEDGIEHAQLLGVNTDRLFLLSYLMSGVVAGLGGTLIAQRTSVSPWLGTPLAIKAFAVAVVCEMVPSWRLLLLAVVLAGVELFSAFFFAPSVHDLPAFILLIGVLWWRPGVFSLATQAPRT